LSIELCKFIFGLPNLTSMIHSWNLISVFIILANTLIYRESLQSSDSDDSNPFINLCIIFAIIFSLLATSIRLYLISKLLKHQESRLFRYFSWCLPNETPVRYTSNSMQAPVSPTAQTTQQQHPSTFHTVT
jgi:hypothetical protein